MSDEGPCFVDSNVLIYALTGDDERRGSVARELIRRLRDAGTLRTSTQVLQEVFVISTRKGARPIPRAKALRYLDALANSPVVVTDYGAIRAAIELMDSASLSFWDALIVVAARRSGATVLYTEDLNDGQVIAGVRVRNPFRD